MTTKGNDYDSNGNRISPYRSIHRNSRQYRDNNGYYHLR